MIFAPGDNYCRYLKVKTHGAFAYYVGTTLIIRLGTDCIYCATRNNLWPTVCQAPFTTSLRVAGVCNIR